MGQQACCCSDDSAPDSHRVVSMLEQKGLGADGLVPTPADAYIVKGKSEGAVVLSGKSEAGFGRSLFEDIEGVYKRSSDKRLMATIVYNRITWAPEFQADPAELLEVDKNKVSISLGPDLHTAKFLPESQELVWDDGDVWEKS
eukprot:TRINITY_DN82359_c0_g1_i1.p1 TRINITY_DN82359_c0_g1~~TRINITY_DN82359_c0_g1_i1.p1  ORF type:complete len:143 (-),score=27.92 TRINITY_DN82359_c0_g1_i1:46-474(-)